MQVGVFVEVAAGVGEEVVVVDLVVGGFFAEGVVADVFVDAGGEAVVVGDVADRALVVGQGSLLVDYVQAAVNNHGTPEFYAQPAFKTMAARVPAEACGYGMSDLSAYARYYVDQIRMAIEASEAAGAAPASADEDGDTMPAPMAEFLKGFDFDRFPPADVVAGYFGTSEGYSVMDSAGFRSTMTIHYPMR